MSDATCLHPVAKATRILLLAAFATDVLVCGTSSSEPDSVGTTPVPGDTTDTEQASCALEVDVEEAVGTEVRIGREAEQTTLTTCGGRNRRCRLVDQRAVVHETDAAGPLGDEQNASADKGEPPRHLHQL